MTFNIPNELYKVFIFIGIIIYAHSELKLYPIQKEISELEKAEIIINAKRDSIKLQQKIEELVLLEKSQHLSIKYGIENPVFIKDSSIGFNDKLEYNKKTIDVYKIIRPLYEKYFRGDLERYHSIKASNSFLETMLIDYKKLNVEFSSKLDFQVIGLLIFLSGVFWWLLVNEWKKKKEFNIENLSPNHCQSCGAMFSSFIKYGGNEKGKANKSYCHECFSEGKFTDRFKNPEDFENHKKNILDCRPSRDKKHLNKRFNNLERWKKDNYFYW